jgi:DNA-binding CsgD family transcriptional regulator
MRVWWVLAGDGSIIFAMGTAGLNEKRLDAAAVVFGLSPAQKQLAAHVAGGRSLPEIADLMGITANTARTHLNRIFDKTGVHSQAALVRILLSVGG